jgi:alpha-N-arabinofuranosidase
LTYEEDFSSDDLDKRWIGLRGPREAFIEKAKNGIQINPFEANVKEVKPTSTLFYRQMHNSFSYAATLDYKPESEKDLAGIVALQSENANYVFGVTKQGDDYVLVLQRNFKRRFRGEMDSKVIASTKIELSEPLRLQVSAKGDKYEFSYAVEGADFVRLGETVSGDILSTDVAGGFTGCLLGLYATSANDALPE